jgi:hypothetical protein
MSADNIREAVTKFRRIRDGYTTRPEIVNYMSVVRVCFVFHAIFPQNKFI